MHDHQLNDIPTKPCDLRERDLRLLAEKLVPMAPDDLMKLMHDPAMLMRCVDHAFECDYPDRLSLFDHEIEMTAQHALDVYLDTGCLLF